MTRYLCGLYDTTSPVLHISTLNLGNIQTLFLCVRSTLLLMDSQTEIFVAVPTLWLIRSVADLLILCPAVAMASIGATTLTSMTSMTFIVTYKGRNHIMTSS